MESAGLRQHHPDVRPHRSHLDPRYPDQRIVSLQKPSWAPLPCQRCGSGQVRGFGCPPLSPPWRCAALSIPSHVFTWLITGSIFCVLYIADGEKAVELGWLQEWKTINSHNYPSRAGRSEEVFVETMEGQLRSCQAPLERVREGISGANGHSIPAIARPLQGGLEGSFGEESSFSLPPTSQSNLLMSNDFTGQPPFS